MKFSLARPVLTFPSPALIMFTEVPYKDSENNPSARAEGVFMKPFPARLAARSISVCLIAGIFLLIALAVAAPAGKPDMV